MAAVSNLTLGQLLNATLTVINKAGTAAADITLLNNAIKTVLQVMPLNLPVKLFGDGGVLDLQVVGGSVTSALQANVNALNILQTALVIANGQNLIDLGLNVPLLGVQSKVRIVEPPTIAVGGGRHGHQRGHPRLPAHQHEQYPRARSSPGHDAGDLGRPAGHHRRGPVHRHAREAVPGAADLDAGHHQRDLVAGQCLFRA